MRRVLLILLIVVFASTVVYLIPDLFQLHPPRWEFYRDPKAYENRYRMIDGRRVEAIASLIGVALIGGVVVLIVPALGKYVLRGAATARERRASRIREMIHQEVGASTSHSEDLVTQLERLGNLHSRGAITDEEFQSLKSRLLM